MRNNQAYLVKFENEEIPVYMEAFSKLEAKILTQAQRIKQRKPFAVEGVKNFTD